MEILNAVQADPSPIFLIGEDGIVKRFLRKA
jgi:hypothetical protein